MMEKAENGAGVTHDEAEVGPLRACHSDFFASDASIPGSPDDALPGPWRQSGVLWPNGKFARPSCTCTISTVRQRGIVIAGILPLALCEEHRRRMEGRWPGWITRSGSSSNEESP